MIVSNSVRLKVFIEGMDVSDYCSNVSVNFRLSDISSLDITLENPGLEFLIEEDDLRIIKSLRDGSNLNNDFPFGEDVRKSFKNCLLKDLVSEELEFGAKSENVKNYLYEYGLYSPIFPYLSNVRVFVEFDGRWYHLFCGLIEAMTVVMGLDDTFSLSISCFDVLVCLRRAVLSTSLAVYEPNNFKRYINEISSGAENKEGENIIKSPFSSSLFYNVDTEFSIYKYNIQSKSLVDELVSLIYGDINIGGSGDSRYGIEGKSVFRYEIIDKGSNKYSVIRNRRAVGLFGLDKLKVCIMSGEHSNELVDEFRGLGYKDNVGVISNYEAWDRLVSDLEVKKDDLYDLCVIEDREKVDSIISNESLSQDAIVQFIGLRTKINGLYSATAGGLKVLLPSSLPKSVYDVLLVNILASRPELERYSFANRFQILKYILSYRTDFVFYATPRGDIVVEYPLYDVDYFGWYDELSKRDVRSFIKDDILGSFSDTVDLRGIATVVSCNPYVGTVEIGSEAGNTFLVPIPPLMQSVFSPSLIAKYGIKIIQADSTYGWVPDNEASARLKAELVMSINNRKLYSGSLSVNFKGCFMLNRPVKIAYLGRVGLVLGCSSSFKPGGSPNLSLSLSYLRQWNGEGYRVAFTERLDTLSIDYSQFFNTAKKKAGK